MVKPLEIIQTDEAGNVTATYVRTVSATGQEDRIDSVPTQRPKKSWQTALDMFLPAGYPHSVTDDYLEYQIYDSLQAFSSSIAGLLSSRAVLEGVGVGDASASATSALLLSILQDSAGRIATILFAHRLGTSLEPECKMYRLLADVFNDMAMILSCLSPAFPKPMRVLLLAFSSVLRSLCGVTAGSSKASLSAHFARWGNLGELNAKDSSQETVISLLGMLVGCLVVKVVHTPFATFSTLMLLLSMHLATNYKAVRSVCMRTLNRQRANIVFNSLIKHDLVLTPKNVSARERIFEHDGILRDAYDRCIGYCRIGIPVLDLLKHLGHMNEPTNSIDLPSERLERLLNLYDDEGYVLFWDPLARMTYILLKKDSDTLVQLKAWYHALLIAQSNDHQDHKANGESMFSLESTTHVAVRKDWESVKARLEQAGWDLETAALETSSASRIHIKS